MTPEEILKYMLIFFQDTDKRLNELRKEQSKADIKQDELLHYIENHNLDAIKACKILKQIKKVRDERRIIKNEIDIIHSLKDTIVDKYNNKFIERDIAQALKEIKETKKRQENPKYSYQFLTEELEIIDE